MSEEVPLIRVLEVLANAQRLEILRKLKTPGSFPPQDEGDPLVDETHLEASRDRRRGVQAMGAGICRLKSRSIP